MKKLFILSIIVTYSSCSNKYNLILDGLSNNNVLLYEEMGKNNYLEYFEVSEEEFEKNFQEYENSVSQFFNSEKEIILYLLNFKNDTLLLCDWIITKNPYSSIIQESDFLTKSEGAIILIDNFLRADIQKIIIPKYYKELDYEVIENFIFQNKKMNKKGLQQKYNEFIQINYKGN